jgi:hypothetical protein
MLSPTEQRRYARQLRELHLLRQKIAAVEAARPFDHLSIPEQVEAQQILEELIRERDELLERLPKGPPEALWMANPIALLHYD